MTVPVTTAVVVPKDFPSYVSDGELLGLLRRWVDRLGVYIWSEVGYVFNYTSRVVHISRTLAELQPSPPDDCGEGFNLASLHNCLSAEGVWPSEVPYRFLCIVLGGGGWAGGNNSWGPTGGGTKDWGFGIIGDWQLRYIFTGAASPCCPYGPGICESEEHGIGAFSHEALNCLGANPYDPVLWVDTPMEDWQKELLVGMNTPDFFYIPSIEPPPEPPTGRPGVAAALGLLGLVVGLVVVNTRRLYG